MGKDAPIETHHALSDDQHPESQVLIAHFKAAREDILQKVQLRDRYVYFCGVSSGLIAYFAMTNEIQGILLLIPVIVWVCALMFAQVEHIIGAQTWYLKTEYTDELQRLFGRSIPHWDSSFAASQFHAANAFRLRYAGVGSIFLIGSWAALAIRVTQNPDRFRFISEPTLWFKGMLTHEWELSQNTFLKTLQLGGVFFKNLWTNLFVNYGIIPVMEVLVFVLVPVISYNLIRGAAARRAKRFAKFQADRSARDQDRKLFIHG